jgi:predicted ATPase
VPFPEGGGSGGGRLDALFGHLAALPAPLDAPAVPPFVWHIVRMLLAKDPAQRYQTAEAALRDIELARSGGPRAERIYRNTPPGGMSAHVGRFDNASRPCVTQQLYGRAREQETLARVLDEVEHGRPHLLLVSGPSGMGKTALVLDVLRPMVAQGHAARFFSGRFDLLRRRAPFTGWVQIFDQIIDHLLALPHAALVGWRALLSERLGPRAASLAAVLPRCQLVLADPVQPALAASGGPDAAAQFNQAFLTLISALAADAPLVLFIDDLHWVDLGTMGLLSALTSARETSHNCLLLVVAARVADITSAHPAALWLDDAMNAARSERPGVTHIALEPLDNATVLTMMHDALGAARTPGEELVAVSDRLHRATAGLPFAVVQALHLMHDCGALTTDGFGVSALDTTRVPNLPERSSISALLEARFARLGADLELKRLLGVAAVIGAEFRCGGVRRLC